MLHPVVLDKCLLRGTTWATCRPLMVRETYAPSIFVFCFLQLTKQGKAQLIITAHTVGGFVG